MSKQVRVRFAPSPTGPLHIGGVRTALCNYLIARKSGGKFVLRIEDTDQNRFVKGAESYIVDSLTWLGIEPDESPAKGGPFSPYRQSERMDIYADYAKQLVKSGHAYYAFDTPEEIADMKLAKEAEGIHTPQYDFVTRGIMRNSLTLTKSEVNKLISEGTPHVIRIKIEPNWFVEFNDAVRGTVSVNSSTIDDKVLLKSDGMPTYHLANVVDDYLMKITLVIRGEEWLPSAPLHVLLYEALGWKDDMPEFAHLPLILKPDGKGKLSKRDSQKSGIPVFPLQWQDPATGEDYPGFREEGYQPDALVNFLALLGWNPGSDRELFTMEELIENFGLDRVIKGGARFDINKAKWFNEQYLRDRDLSELGSVVKRQAADAGYQCTENFSQKVAELMRDRVTFPAQLFSEAKYFFDMPGEYDEKVVRKKWTKQVVGLLRSYAEALSKHGQITAIDAKKTLEEVLEGTEMHLGMVMQPLRVAVSGMAGGPDLMEIVEILGPEEVIRRIERAVDTLPLKDS